MIRVTHLSRQFSVPVRQAGLRSAFKSLFRREMQQVTAVDDISFHIEPGEMVGFLGPNGAGKTTTLKMLAGLVHPTGGQVQVNGFVPARRDKALLREIALVMGNRSQLAWDIPVADSLQLFRSIYRVPVDVHRRTLDELVELLGLEPLLSKPVRNLSLGERMKCELAAALLHRPKVLFLDEPTLGLDVVSQRNLRRFIADYNRRFESTILLTSHYMADVEALCQRVMVIHRGKLLYDGGLDKLVDQVSPAKTVTVDLSERRGDLTAYGEVTADKGARVTLRVAKPVLAAAISRLMEEQQVNDLTITDAPVDEIIERIFVKGLI